MESNKTNIRKHAYLIIAYHQFDLLRKIIELIDDERNDVYIHIDSKIQNVPVEYIKEAASHSSIIFTKRVAITRGTYTIGDSELVLLEEAVNSGIDYEYYHLISGQDMPIKSQNYIHEFFDKYGNNGTVNFVDVCPPESMKKSWYYRISLYQIFVPLAMDNSLRSKILKFIQRLFMLLQLLLGVNRFRKYEKAGYTLCYGSSWFSITHDFAKYILDNRAFFEKVYSNHTYIAEESMIQTLLMSSSFKDTLFMPEKLKLEGIKQNMRLIFWTGNISPETISEKHLDDIKKSGQLFARKFDIIKESKVVDLVYDMVKQADVE